MAEGRNIGLDHRMTELGEAMVKLAETVDENLRTVLLAMTTEEQLQDGLALHHTTPLQEDVMQNAVLLFALEGPVARDLLWSMAMMRLAKDYERIADLTRALMRRVERLTDTLHEEVLHAMTDVMRLILRLHGLILVPARPAFRLDGIDWSEHERAVEAVNRAIQEIDQLSVAALLSGEGSPENLRELVLATRHIQRISHQLERMPAELNRLGSG
ncbi:MAG: hypothetical protein QNJ90_15810 [Planctomycetota bacterium]|nr:hypothetical protein [Planctomycetota bacterium]